ncbi:hypothetical protein [Microcoleus sp. Pol12B5]|uniref:hypothetical protein n=1 Tax=Microcoleus sp. Pol12B5 TaxID=3055396 RepID=UPI002FD17759
MAILGIVEYLPQLNSVKQTGDLFIGGMQLVTGKNEVDIETWKEHANHPLIKKRIEQGILRVFFDQPTVITPPENKRASRTSTPVETKLEQEVIPIAVDTSTFVVRPPEVEKTPTPPKK